MPNIELKKIGDLIPYFNNPRHNDAAVDKVAESIKQFGFQNPIIVDRENVVIAGHTRLKAAELLGLEEIPVIVAKSLTDEQARAYRLADNKTGEFSEWDINALDKEIAELNEIDLSLFGFDISEISPDSFGEEFTLPDGEKSEMEQMTFTLHCTQAEVIREALKLAKEMGFAIDSDYNNNSNGNLLFGVVSDWVEQKK